MTFRPTSRMRFRRLAPPVVTERRLLVEFPRVTRAECEACPYLMHNVCLHPNCGCPKNRRRVNPWEAGKCPMKVPRVVSLAVHPSPRSSAQPRISPWI